MSCFEKQKLFLESWKMQQASIWDRKAICTRLSHIIMQYVNHFHLTQGLAFGPSFWAENHFCNILFGAKLSWSRH